MQRTTRSVETGHANISRGTTSRRRFLTAAGASVAVITLDSGTRLAFADPNDPVKGDVLVYLFLRGAADGLSLVPPVAYPSYYALRVQGGFDIAVPASSAISIGHPVLALHPAMAPLMPFWDAGEMAIVHAAGSPASLTATRSHFEAEEVWERCGLRSTTATGWIGRHLQTSGDVTGNLAGISHDQRLWSALEGHSRALAISNIYNFDIFGYSDRAAARGVLSAGHVGSGIIESEGADTLGAVSTISNIDFGAFPPQNGAVYDSGNSLARELDQIAKLIRADIGLRAVTVDLGGWDTHDDMGPAIPGERMYDRIARLAQGLAPFLHDLGPDTNEVTVVMVSEFGRTIHVNGSGGTDHGRGGVMMAFGKGINGGVYGGFPSVIEDGPEGDLEVLTDFRQVYAEIIDRRLLNGANSSYVLNGYATPGHLGLATPS
jgi:uncharacterized protein (DUF1501 family)